MRRFDSDPRLQNAIPPYKTKHFFAFLPRLSAPLETVSQSNFGTVRRNTSELFGKGRNTTLSEVRLARSPVKGLKHQSRSGALEVDHFDPRLKKELIQDHNKIRKAGNGGQSRQTWVKSLNRYNDRELADHESESLACTAIREVSL